MCWRRRRRSWQLILWSGGIVLTGGGALLDGLEEILTERTGINAMTAENPACAVAEGTGMYAEMMAQLGK